MEELVIKLGKAVKGFDNTNYGFKTDVTHYGDNVKFEKTLAWNRAIPSSTEVLLIKLRHCFMAAHPEVGTGSGLINKTLAYYKPKGELGTPKLCLYKGDIIFDKVTHYEWDNRLVLKESIVEFEIDLKIKFTL